MAHERFRLGRHVKLTMVNVPASENVLLRGIIDILPAQTLTAEISDAARLTEAKFRYTHSQLQMLCEPISLGRFYNFGHECGRSPP